MTDLAPDTKRASLQNNYRNEFILVFLWSFVIAILVSSFINISPLISVSFIALSGAIFVAEKVHKKFVTKEIIFIVLTLLSFGLGSLRYAIKDFHELQKPTDAGYVVDEPEHRDTDTRFIFQSNNGERVLVSTDMYSHVEYGDTVSVKGKLERPGVIVENDGRSFDYAAYLSKDDIYYTMSFAKVSQFDEKASSALGQASGKSRPILFRLTGILIQIKNSLVSKMKQILPEPESSLLAGLIVSGKQALPSAVLDEFKRAGVVHIVVLSGYNITIVAEFFLALLGFLSLRRRAVVSSIAIILFVLMTGATATVVRAGIMALIVLLGKVIHRQHSVSRTLLLAGALMLLENPKLLVFDPSFELTFLAMLALVYVEPVVSSKLSFITEKYGLKTLLATTIATQATVLPFLLYSVGNVSIVSLLSNVLILVFVPFTMLIGFIAVLIAFVSSSLALPLTFITHLLLAWILGVASVLGNLSFASIKISHFPMWLTLMLYAGLGFILWRLRQPVQERNSPHKLPSSS
jgi:competence protein ComEC